MENLFFFWGMTGVSVALLFTTRFADAGFGRYAGSLLAGPLGALCMGSATYALIGESRTPWLAASAAAVTGSILAMVLLEYTVFKFIGKNA